MAAGLFLACGSTHSISGYYSYETECLGADLSGSQTVKTWGTGRNQREARKDAYRKALQDIIFKGIRNGNEECDVRPLLSEANAKDKYEYYFNDFFSDKGLYSSFISEKGRGLKKNEKSNSKEAFGYVIEVNVSGLKERLRYDKILR